MIHLQLILFLLILVGIYARKREFLTRESRKKLTDLFINIILPCNIITSFHIQLTPSLLSSAGLVLLIAFGVQFYQWLLSRFLYVRIPQGKQMVVRYGTICSNSGFMGNPVIEGIYGMNGLFFASISLIPVRIFMWTAGLSLFTKSDRKTVIHTLVFHPCIVAVYLGLALMAIQFRIPQFMIDTIKYISNCTTAVAMIIIGSILADVDFRSVVDKLMLFYSAVRLLLIPITVFIALRLLHIPELLTGITVLLAGMPAGSTTAILALEYGCDSEYASKVVLFTTFLSLVTLPILSWMLTAF
jgi:predicted permease